MTDRRIPIVASVITHFMMRSIRRHFAAVRLSGLWPDPKPGQGVIVYANHPSWWDPAVFALLQNRMFPGRRGYGPIDAEAVRAYPLLEYAGFMPLDRTSSSSRRHFLTTATKYLNEGHVVWITVEGTFADPRKRPLHPQPGIAHLMKGAPQALVIPLALDYAFWTESRPEILLRLGAPAISPAESITEERLILCRDALTATLDVLLAAASERNPYTFETLLTGRAGIGGVYDFLRRILAWKRGIAFNPRHDRSRRERRA